IAQCVFGRKAFQQERQELRRARASARGRGVDDALQQCAEGRAAAGQIGIEAEEKDELSLARPSSRDQFVQECDARVVESLKVVDHDRRPRTLQSAEEKIETLRRL